MDWFRRQLCGVGCVDKPGLWSKVGAIRCKAYPTYGKNYIANPYTNVFCAVRIRNDLASPLQVKIATGAEQPLATAKFAAL